jgi:methylamine utilization protein MauE
VTELLDPLPYLTIALTLAALFAASTLHKLLALEEWPGVVRNFRLVPEVLAIPIAGAVLCAEALVAGALLWSPARQAGGCVAAALLITYAAAIWINLRRGRTRIDCGCFGSRRRQGIAAWMVGRNMLLALFALTLLLPTSHRPLSLAEVAVAVACVVTLGLLYPVLAVVVRSPPPTFDQNYHAAVRARVSR